MPVLRSIFLCLFLLAVLVVGWAGFRGEATTQPPLQILPDMDDQAKVKAQSGSTFFADGKGARALVPGTVPMGLKVATASAAVAGPSDGPTFSVGHDYYNTGRFGDYWGDGMPEQVVMEPALIRRGAERYGIYCAVCHGATGAGDGVTAKYGVPMAAGNFYLPNFTDENDPNYRTDGNIFSTITYGKGQMGPYGAMIPVGDRWAIIAYVRTLQMVKVASTTPPAPAAPAAPAEDKK